MKIKKEGVALVMSGMNKRGSNSDSSAVINIVSNSSNITNMRERRLTDSKDWIIHRYIIIKDDTEITLTKYPTPQTNLWRFEGVDEFQVLEYSILLIGWRDCF